MSAEKSSQTTPSATCPSPAMSSMSSVKNCSDASKDAIKFEEQTRYLTKSRVIMVFLACAAVDMVALIDQTTLSVSLSTIGGYLYAGAQQSWIVNGYFIATTAFQLLYGRLSDILSRKVVLLAAIGFFFLGSIGASQSQTLIQLIIFRSITGIGGGALMTLAQVIISDVVTLRERGKYQGVLGAVIAISNGVGPIIGGAIASKSAQSWRWIFRLNLFLSGFAAVCIVLFMPLKGVKDSWAKKLRAIDYAGSLLVLAASILVVLGLTWVGTGYAWSSAHVLAPLLTGIATAGAFLAWEWKGHPLPLMPLRMFKRRIVCGACLGQFINGWNVYVQIFYIPTFYQVVYGYSALKAGYLLLAVIVTNSLTSTTSGFIVSWRGKYRESILAGWVVWAVGLGLFSTLDENSGVAKAIGYSLLIGLGVGQTMQPSLIAVQAGVPRADMAVVTSLRTFVRQLGATLGLAVAGTIINSTVRSRVLAAHVDLSAQDISTLISAPAEAGRLGGPRADVLRAALLDGYRTGFRVVFIVMAALCAVAFAAVCLLIPEVGLDRDDDAQLKADEKARMQAEADSKAGRAEKAVSVPQAAPAATAST